MNFPKQPMVGDIVLFNPKPDDSIAKSNYNNEAIPAIITRVWGPICVNIKIIPDCGAMQDRTSVVHITQNPATYNWFYNDERDSISPDESINLMKYASYQMIDPNSEDDIKLVEAFFEGLRSKSKIVRGTWIKFKDFIPKLGKSVLTKDSEGILAHFTRVETTALPEGFTYRLDEKCPHPGEGNNPLIEWLEEK